MSSEAQNYLESRSRLVRLDVCVTDAAEDETVGMWIFFSELFFLAICEMFLSNLLGEQKICFSWAPLSVLFEGDRAASENLIPSFSGNKKKKKKEKP